MNSSAKLVLGSSANFWLWDETTNSIDLTHPRSPTSEPVWLRITLDTANNPITIAPEKTALVITDMQNIALAQPFVPRGPGHNAEEALLQHAIPAARRAGIQIVWLTWGFSEADLQTLDPTTSRIFQFELDGTHRPGAGIGEEMGPVEVYDDDGGDDNNAGSSSSRSTRKVEGGRLLVRDQWNTALHAPLEAASSPEDVRFHKTRIAGLSGGPNDECASFLARRGIATLLFAGVNTEMCVMASLQNANLRGFDTILLIDGCGTTNGDAAIASTRRSCTRAWGFLSSCKDLEAGVERMESGERKQG